MSLAGGRMSAACSSGSPLNGCASLTFARSCLASRRLGARMADRARSMCGLDASICPRPGPKGDFHWMELALSAAGPTLGRPIRLAFLGARRSRAEHPARTCGILLDFLGFSVGIETYQWVTRHKARKILP